jgi:hypothetical protein
MKKKSTYFMEELRIMPKKRPFQEGDERVDIVRKRVVRGN